MSFASRRVLHVGQATSLHLPRRIELRGFHESRTERYNESGPVNLGTGVEISIEELIHLIARLTRFDGDIQWDTAKPDGQPRRCLDTAKAELLFGFRARTTLKEGLERTISWYLKNPRQ